MKVGISSCGKLIDRALLGDMDKYDVRYLELSLGSDYTQDRALNGIKRLADEYGITLWSFHLPFAPFSRLNPASFDKELRDRTVERFSELINRAADIGITRFVVHPSGERVYEPKRPQAIEYAKDTFSRLMPLMKKRGLTLCVEDLPRLCLGNCSDDILKLISADDSIRVCFDTNHLLKQSDVDFVNAVAGKIETLHVSDFDFVNERHWLPGEGDIEWQPVIKALTDSGYAGPWLYEVNFSAEKTIVRDRLLTVKDFADNAKALFEGRTPEAIGCRKPNLGMWG